MLLLLKMVVEYCQCVDDIPSVAPDLLTRLVDLLKVSFLVCSTGLCYAAEDGCRILPVCR